MKFLLRTHEKIAKLFEKGAKFERFEPLFEAHDTFVFTPASVTQGASHVRDALDLKRLMITVVVALVPCVLMAMYNTGYQANLAIADGAQAAGWRGAVLSALNIGCTPEGLIACFIHGALYYFPVVIVTLAIGGAWEALFAIVRNIIPNMATICADTSIMVHRDMFSEQL